MSAKRLPTLVVLSGPNVLSRVFRVNDGETIIGRSFDSNVWLDEASISRHHARIEPLDERFRVIDLDSKNGTFVNDASIREHTLNEGDRIQVGLRTVLLFTYQEEDIRPTR
jgi:pSer/pThr/pTyr-binding forkhead associated (FHA) protein